MKSEDAFYHGILVGLQVIKAHGAEVMAQELACTVDRVDLTSLAKEQGGIDLETMKWVNEIVF